MFGPTTLEEGQGNNGQAVSGPAVGTSSGNNDIISVTGPTANGSAHFTNLFAAQDVTLNAATPSPFGGGTNESITISQIQVAAFSSTLVNPAGVTTVQGNGARDTTTITNVTTYSIPGIPGGLNLPLPAGTAYASINVTQGTGANGIASPPPVAVNDTATVTGTTVGGTSVPGYISITQNDVASNSPSWNSATIKNSIAGGSTPLALPGGSALSIKQGDAGTTIVKGVLQGPGDTALIMNSTAKAGNASITQGNGINDSATIDPSSIAGNATISQGNGASDSASISNDTIGGNASITQADVAGAPFGDIAGITNNPSIGGNASIGQGSADHDVATIKGPPAILPTATIGGNASITQVNGNSDTAVIAYLKIGTAGKGLGTISIGQGTGNNDAAEIENVIDPGGIDGTTPAPITIGITQGNGSNDIAAIVNLNATGGAATAPTLIFITQGTGNADWAEIADVIAPNANVTITQNDLVGNANGDTALVLFTSVGTSTTNPDGSVNDFNGNVTINQGSAPGDIALVAGGFLVLDDSNDDGPDLSGNANNVTITQGSNGATNGALVSFNGSQIYPDVAEIDDETVTSDITITQGNANSLGYYVTAIAFDYLGLVPGLVPMPTPPSQFTALVPPFTISSPVTAGGVTAIQQFGANNQVFLGSLISYFATNFLDVYTGGGGGALVVALNTVTSGAAPLGGVFSSIYNVEGGGTGNEIFLDYVSSFYVTYDPAHFVRIS